LYGNEPSLHGKYDKANLLIENNIIYDHGGLQIIYNPGTTPESSIGGPIIFRHNTVISGNQDATWNNTMTAINRFRANTAKQTYMLRFGGVPGDVQPVGEALPFINSYNYDGTGSYFEDNVMICEGNLSNYVKSPYISPNMKLKYRNNLIYGQVFTSIPLDASNVNIADQITKGKLPKDFIDTQLFLAPNYSKAHGLTYEQGSAFDLTPKAGSILCTMSTTGGYVGAIPPLNLTTSRDFDLKNKVLIFPNPCADILRIATEDEKGIEICIVDMFGKVVYKNTGTNNCDVSRLKSGIYHVKVTNGNELFSQKLIKN
jgi:hypothetical protein